MALERKDNIGDTSTTTGTGTLNLTAVAQTGAQIFAGNVTSGSTVRYDIRLADGSEWEVGEGVFTDGSPDTLTRGTVYASSNSGSLVNFSAGTKNVSLVFVVQDIIDIMSALNPVGTIREFNVSTNPSTLLGFGTWTAYGVGRMTVCLDSLDATMDTVGETGGSKTVTIAQTNLPNISTGAGTAHTHIQNSHNHTRAGQSTGGSGGIRYDASTGTSIVMDSTTATNQNESAHTHPLGGSGTALNVMNPFITVYRWVRTA